MSEQLTIFELLIHLEAQQDQADEIYHSSRDLVNQLYTLSIQFHLENPDLIKQARVAQYTAFRTLIEFHKIIEKVSDV